MPGECVVESGGEGPGQLPQSLNNHQEDNTHASPATPLNDIENIQVLRCKFMVGLKFMSTVSHVKSPTKFWIQPSNNIAQRISDEIRCMLIPEDYHVPLRRVERDKYCLAPSALNLYLRAQILNVDFTSTVCRMVCVGALGNPLARVVYIDYGDSAWVSTEKLLYIPPLLSHYPWQATLCRLHKVVPEGERMEWDKEAVESMKKLVDKKLLLAQIMSFCPDFNCHKITLCERVAKLDNDSGESHIKEVHISSLLSQIAGPHVNIVESEEAQRNVDRIQFDCPGLENLPPITPLPWQMGIFSQNQAQTSLANGATSAATSSQLSGGDGTSVAKPRRRRMNLKLLTDPTLSANLSTSNKDGSLSGTPAANSSLDDSTDSDYTGRIWVGGANPTDPRLFRGEQIPEIDMGDIPNWTDPKTDEIRVWACGAVVNPGEFYLHPLRPGKDPLEEQEHFTHELNKLTSDLDSFYSKDRNREMIPVARLSALDSGQKMFGICRRGEGVTDQDEGEWHRVQLLSADISQDQYRNIQAMEERGRSLRDNPASDSFHTLIRVRFLDWGGTTYKLSGSVFKIHRRFCQTPPMAWPCSLFGVRTLFGRDTWTSEVVEAFRQLIRVDMPMDASVIDKIDGVGAMLEVILISREMGERVEVNQRLVQMKVAENA